MQSCFHQRVFFLIDPTIICSKQPSLSPLLLLIALLFIHQAKSLLQIHSPMAREWMSCLFFMFIYSLTFSASLTYRHLMRENIGLNNVESYSESLSIRMARSLNRCGSINNVFYAISHLSLGLTTEKNSLFSSIEFLLTNYRTYNLIMEWSCEDVVRWATQNLCIDDIITARLRGKFWSVRRRELLSPLFTWCHLSRRCASGILLYSWPLSID